MGESVALESVALVWSDVLVSERWWGEIPILIRE